MWRILPVVLLAVTSIGPPREVSAQTGSMDREAVSAAHDRWFAGILGRYDVLADVLAPDVTLRFPSGPMPRSEFLNLLEKKELFYDSAEHHEREIRVYGDAGIVTGKSTLKFRLRGNAGSEQLDYTAVYNRAGGKWTLVAWQSNRPALPELSRFFGIVIGMFYNEHGPAHFHAVYGEHEATFEIESGQVQGDLPPRALALVREWAQLHREELLQNWERARSRQPLQRIAPLE